jgi:hypothetical protein
MRTGFEIAVAAVEETIRLSEGKHCPVGPWFRRIPVLYDIEIIEEKTGPFSS